MSQNVFVIAALGASDWNDRNTRDHPNLLGRSLQIGKTSRVRMGTFGREGVGSPTWISEGRTAAIAGAMPDVALLSFFADASSALGISTSTSLTNILAIIDAIRAKRSSTAIFLMKMWHMPNAQEAATFPNLANYYANYPTVVGSRSNVAIIDTYTAWGDPALNPSEFDPSDQIHPLLPGHLRVTIPVVSAALAPLIT
jgi:hypothetical protein